MGRLGGSHDVTDEWLRKSVIFSALDDVQLESVRRGMRTLQLREGESLFDDQQKAERFFLLQRGQIKLSRLSASGSEKVIEIVRPGEVFASAVMFMEQENYPVRADAIRPSVVHSFLNVTFLQIMRESPDTCFRLMAHLSQRLRRQVHEIDNLCLQNASFRLVQFLIDHVTETGGGAGQIVLNAPKNVIASRLSIQPETFSRLLRSFSRKGLIEVDNKIVRIPDVDNLRAFVETCEACPITGARQRE